MRVGSSGTKLTHRDTRFVKAMLERGDRQHDIAAYFGVNGGRIAEVANGNNEYPNAPPSEDEKLPPTGPYLTKYELRSVIYTLYEAIEAINMAEAEEDITDVKAALILARETIQRQIDQLEEV